jgi:hypothetical protein
METWNVALGRSNNQRLRNAATVGKVARQHTILGMLVALCSSVVLIGQSGMECRLVLQAKYCLMSLSGQSEGPTSPVLL